ncbi:MAG: fumarylacetoacetate hydrolase family protein [Alphaproteobacteria bacterium]
MKLASLKTGGRDGTLIVVSENLQQAVRASDIADRLQDALEDWHNIAPQLQILAHQLEAGSAEGMFSLDPQLLAAPLPRAYQWLDGSAYVNHVELVRKARGDTVPESYWHDPLMYQGGSDYLLGPCDDIVVESENFGIDFEAEIAVITKDVPQAVSVEKAGDYIALVLLVNDVSLRRLIPDELAKGFGFLHGKPPTAFSPVAVTPEALGKYWHNSSLHLPVQSYINGAIFGRPNAGVDLTFNFAQLIAHAARTRPLSAGTIIGSGTISNRDRAVGSSCIVERRTLEKIEQGNITTEFLHFGDVVKIMVEDEKGHNIFGTIEQKITQLQRNNNDGRVAA